MSGRRSRRASPGFGDVLQLIPLCGGVDGGAGRGGPVARRSCEAGVVCALDHGVFWRQNARGRSSFHRYPAKRAVLTLGDSPARCVHVPVAPTVVSAFMHMPASDTHTGHSLPASSQAHRRGTRASAQTGIQHNAQFCVLTTSRQGQASPPPPPAAYITRNSSHKPEFHIRTKLGRPSGRDKTNQFDHEQQMNTTNKILNNKNGMADLNKLNANPYLIPLRENLESPKRLARTARNNSTSRQPQPKFCTRRPPTHRPPMLTIINLSKSQIIQSASNCFNVIQITDTPK